MIYSVYGFLLRLWSILFAITYESAASPVNFDSAGSVFSVGWALVWAQTVAEIAVGASLFIVADTLQNRYSLGEYIENLDYLYAKHALGEHQAVHEKLTAERNEKHARETYETACSTMRNTYISMKNIHAIVSLIRDGLDEDW